MGAALGDSMTPERYRLNRTKLTIRHHRRSTGQVSTQQVLGYTYTGGLFGLHKRLYYDSETDSIQPPPKQPHEWEIVHIPTGLAMPDGFALIRSLREGCEYIAALLALGEERWHIKSPADSLNEIDQLSADHDKLGEEVKDVLRRVHHRLNSALNAGRRTSTWAPHSAIR